MKVHQRPVGQVVKTAASHAVNIGSNPVRVTRRRSKVRFAPAVFCAKFQRWVVKLAGCSYSTRALPEYRRKRPCTRAHLPALCMSLRGAGQPPRDVAIRSPAAAHNEKQHLGRIRSSLRVRLKCYFFLPFSAGKRIATPVCALVRNDMQKTERRLRLQGRGAQGARKHAGCQRGQGTGSQ